MKRADLLRSLCALPFVGRLLPSQAPVAAVTTANNPATIHAYYEEFAPLAGSTIRIVMVGPKGPAFTDTLLVSESLTPAMAKIWASGAVAECYLRSLGQFPIMVMSSVHNLLADLRALGA